MRARGGESGVRLRWGRYEKNTFSGEFFDTGGNGSRARHRVWEWNAEWRRVNQQRQQPGQCWHHQRRRKHQHACSITRRAPQRAWRVCGPRRKSKFKKSWGICAVEIFELWRCGGFGCGGIRGPAVVGGGSGAVGTDTEEKRRTEARNCGGPRREREFGDRGAGEELAGPDSYGTGSATVIIERGGWLWCSHLR